MKGEMDNLDVIKFALNEEIDRRSDGFGEPIFNGEPCCLSSLPIELQNALKYTWEEAPEGCHCCVATHGGKSYIALTLPYDECYMECIGMKDMESMWQDVVIKTAKEFHIAAMKAKPAKAGLIRKVFANKGGSGIELFEGEHEIIILLAPYISNSELHKIAGYCWEMAYERNMAVQETDTGQTIQGLEESKKSIREAPDGFPFPQKPYILCETIEGEIREPLFFGSYEEAHAAMVERLREELALEDGEEIPNATRDELTAYNCSHDNCNWKIFDCRQTSPENRKLAAAVEINVPGEDKPRQARFEVEPFGEPEDSFRGIAVTLPDGRVLKIGYEAEDASLRAFMEDPDVPEEKPREIELTPFD